MTRYWQRDPVRRAELRRPDDIDRAANPAPPAQSLSRQQPADYSAFDRDDVDEGLAVVAGQEEVWNVACRLGAIVPAPDLVDEKLLTNIGLNMAAVLIHVIGLEVEKAMQFLEQDIQNDLVRIIDNQICV